MSTPRLSVAYIRECAFVIRWRPPPISTGCAGLRGGHAHVVLARVAEQERSVAQAKTIVDREQSHAALHLCGIPSQPQDEDALPTGPHRQIIRLYAGSFRAFRGRF